MAPTKVRGRQLTELSVGFSLFETTPTAKTYKTVAPWAFTLSGLTNLKTSSGTLTFSVQIDGVAVGGLTSLSVSPTPQSPDASSANAVSAGSVISLIVASVSSAVDLQVAVRGLL